MSNQKSALIKDIYKSRKNLISYLKKQNYDVENHENFTFSELSVMKQNSNNDVNQLDFEVFDKEEKNKCSVIYYLKPSIKQTILEDHVREYYEENDKNTSILIIITLSSINDTIQKTIRQLWEKFNEYVILFDIPNLLINILVHKYVPEHIKLTDEKKQEVYNQYNILDDKQVPQISAFDPVAKCILLKPGQLCKINRFNKISFNNEFYRICVI